MSARPLDDRHRLVAVAVTGRVAPARIAADPPPVDDAGRLVLLPGHGGIALGIHVGDHVMAYLADHLMVGAAIEDDDGPPAVAGPMHQLACLGDRVRDASGRAIGVVAGKRGGLAPGFIGPQLVSVEAPDARLDTLQPGDRVVVEAVGRGLSMPDHPGVALMNLSPVLLDALPIAVGDHAVEIAVRAVVPSRAAGPGLGQDSWIGDLEIADPSEVDGWEELCFGDLVAVSGLDGRVSRFPRPGYVSVGVVSHGPSPLPGHGIGLTLVASGAIESLEARTSADASVADVLRELARWTRSEGGLGPT